MLTKLIKVSEKTKNRLEEKGNKKDTYNDIIERLLNDDDSKRTN